jgi:hemerythrin
MSFITWTDQHNIGVEHIDEQHRHLVDLVNAVFAVMEAGSSRDELTRTLDELVDFTLQHFLTEERIMENHDFPGTAAHVAEHKALLDQARDFRARVLNGDLLMSFALVMQMRAWALTHIDTLDRELGTFLSDRTEPVDTP